MNSYSSLAKFDVNDKVMFSTPDLGVVYGIVDAVYNLNNMDVFTYDIIDNYGNFYPNIPEIRLQPQL